jgi:5-methylcytosine-specific restriction endonuclease McrA
MDQQLRELVWKRAESTCEYCHMPQSLDPLPFEVDHIVARKHGGATVEDNLALSCFACNNRKGPNIAGRDSQTGEIVPLFNPRHDRWQDHFGWNGALLTGRTPTGRATIDVLCINLPHRVAFRASLVSEGVFPAP